MQTAGADCGCRLPVQWSRRLVVFGTVVAVRIKMERMVKATVVILTESRAS